MMRGEQIMRAGCLMKGECMMKGECDKGRVNDQGRMSGQCIGVFSPLSILGLIFFAILTSLSLFF